MSVVSDYLKTVTPAQKAIFESICKIVTDTVPNTEEVISYGLPAFKYRGKYLLGFFAYKDHLSLFPTAGPIEAFKDQLGDFKLSRGTIQFTEDHPIPEALIKEIVELRAADIDEGH